MSNVQRLTGKRTDNLVIHRYHTWAVPTPKGMVLNHGAVVRPEGAAPGTETKTVSFAVPMAQQDDLAVLETRWRTAIDQLQQAYALDGRLVLLDIKIPLFIIKKKQDSVPEVIKELLNEESA